MSANRFEQNFHILNKWLCLRQRGQSLLPYFEDNLIKNVAIYGMGALGERLYDELKDMSVGVSYAIDRMAEQKKIKDLIIYGLDKTNYVQTELVIVTPVHDYWGIVETLKDKVQAPIVSLEDIVDYVYNISGI